MIGVRFSPGLADLMVPASTVKPHPMNPNNGDVDEIVASVVKVGCYRAITANERTGHILIGHHLYAALLELGAEMIPVVWGNYTDEEEVRILFGDNRIARLARLDPAIELEGLEYLMRTESGLSGSGYREDDIEKMRKQAMKDIEEPLQINLKGSGIERLIHEIECPSCGHVWVRGHGQDD